jgi:2-polyprenyl-6-methoxyphenol hydroxylase-like FAD-dependent oxidoreductase
MTSAKNLLRSDHLDCQVLVVGAGPTGLVLTAELLARGIATTIIDKSDGVILESRACAIHARALEVLDTMGLADQFLERGQVVRRFRMYTDGKPLVNLDLSRNGSHYACMLDIPQNETEALLRARVGALGGRVEQGAQLLAVNQDGDRVTATVEDAGGERHTIASAYLVGCDGAHSRVRHELGLSFDGHTYPQDWLLANVRMDWSRPEDEFHAFFCSHGSPMICLPLRDHVWRLILPFAGERDRGAPTFEEIQRLVDQRAPQRVVLSDPTWLATFRCHRRSTNVYRRGSVLLAGDAVHIHTPAGGQGMNTGILDAHNLAWKLALVASGRSPTALLDTYGQERGPVAAEVLRLTHALVKLGTMTGPVERAVRDTVAPVASRIPAVQRRTVRRMSHHHVAYRASRLTRPDRALSRPRPGDRAPDIEVVGTAGTLRLHQALRGGRHLLLLSDADPLAPFDWRDLLPYQDEMEVVWGLFDRANRFRGRRAGTVFVIRPDGYIAARGASKRLSRVLDYLRQVFGSAPSSRRSAWPATAHSDAMRL